MDSNISPVTKLREAYWEHLVLYLETPSDEKKKTLLEKMKKWAPWSGVFLAKLQRRLKSLEFNNLEVWRELAGDMERNWFFEKYPKLKEIFFATAEKRGLAKKKWVITYI